MDRGPWLVDRFGNPIRPEHPVYQPFSSGEKLLGIGGLSLGFIGAGESPLLAIYPMTNHPIIVVVLAIQSAFFLFVGMGLALYVGVNHFTGISWSVRQVIRHPMLWIFAIALLVLAVLFGWQTIHINRLQTGMAALTEAWDLTPEQQSKFDQDLGVSGVILSTRVDELIGNTDSQIYAGRVTSILQHHGYKGPLEMGSIRPDLQGFYITMAPNVKTAPLAA